MTQRAPFGARAIGLVTVSVWLSGCGFEASNPGSNSNNEICASGDLECSADTPQNRPTDEQPAPAKEDGQQDPIAQDMLPCESGTHTCSLSSEICVPLSVSPGFLCEPIPSDPGNGDDNLPEPVEPKYGKDGWCSENDWAACVDFDGYGDVGSGGRQEMRTSDQEALGVTFQGYDVGNIYRKNGRVYELDCSSTFADGSDCKPYLENGQVRLNPESASFGLSMLRLKRPIEFVDENGLPETRHIHFDTSMVMHGRLFVVLHVSELPVESLPDLRLLGTISSSSDPKPSYSLMFLGNSRYGINAIRWNPSGQNCGPENRPGCYKSEQLFSGQMHFTVDPANPSSRDVMHGVDVYLGNGHIKISIDGQGYVDQDIEDIGIDRGYISVAAAAYNPLKDAGGRSDWRGELSSSLFDNLAFDGRTFKEHALTPPGQKYFVFHASGATSCTVAGQYSGLVAPAHDTAWNPVYTLVPEDVGPYTSEDISCTHTSERSKQSGLRNLHFLSQ